MADMKNILFILTLLAGATALSSCKQNETMDYAAPGKVYFFERTMYLGTIETRVDALNYSFAINKTQLTEHDFDIKVKLLGRVADYDRAVKVAVVEEGTTAVEGKHFKINDGVIKAGEYMGVVPVTLYNTPDLATTSVTVKLTIAGNKDFELGLPEDAFMSLTFSNVLLKPADWLPYYPWQTYFGDYSANKYKFIIDQLGLTTLTLATRYDTGPREGVYTASQVMMMVYQLKQIYAEWRVAHGPIYMDDNADPKVEISFP